MQKRLVINGAGSLSKFATLVFRNTFLTAVDPIFTYIYKGFFWYVILLTYFS